MPKWNEFVPSEIEYDFDKDKLRVHRLSIEEAVQAFFNEHSIRKNKAYGDRYRLFGRTDGGRRICVIFQLKPQGVVRIITGWDL